MLLEKICHGFTANKYVFVVVNSTVIFQTECQFNPLSAPPNVLYMLLDNNRLESSMIYTLLYDI